MPDVEVAIYLHQSWPYLVDDINRQTSGTHTLIIGYSLGANNAVLVANRVSHVDSIIALQPSMFASNQNVTGDVGRIIEIYDPNPWMTFGGMGSRRLVGPNIEYVMNNDSHPGAQFNSEFRSLVKSEIARLSAEDQVTPENSPLSRKRHYHRTISYPAAACSLSAAGVLFLSGQCAALPGRVFPRSRRSAATASQRRRRRFAARISTGARAGRNAIAAVSSHRRRLPHSRAARNHHHRYAEHLPLPDNRPRQGNSLRIRRMRVEGLADNEIAGLFRHAADKLDEATMTKDGEVDAAA